MRTSVNRLICAAAIVLAPAFGAIAVAGGHHHHHGHGGTHFSFGLNFSPAPYYRPVYAYPAYAYPAYAYPAPVYYGVAAPPPVYQYAAQPVPAPAVASTPTPTPTWQAAQAKGSIDVRLPDPQGEVWVDGQKVGGGGTVRTYRDVAAGDAAHIYKVTAAWHDRGRLVTEERVVDLSAGGTTSVDFTRPEQTASKAGSAQ